MLLHRFTCFWASLYTWFNPAWPVTVTGRENIVPGETYMIVANHLSLLDILVIFRLFKDFKWVSKIEVFRVPVIGWNMSLNRYVPLRRGDRESVLQMLEACRGHLEEGSSIMMFPEGTRSADGQLKPFKPGAFQLARECEVAVTPWSFGGPTTHCPSAASCCRGGIGSY